MFEDSVAHLRVRTPEGISFSFLLASPVTRLAAWSVDKAVVAAAWSVISLLVSFLSIVSADIARGVITVGYLLISLGYGIATEWLWNGQTLGKRLLRLRVMDESGLPLRFSQVVVRNLLRSVDVLPVAYLLGGLAATFSQKAQRLGDVAGATIVVREPALGGINLGALTFAKYNSLRGQQHLAARLRTKTSPALAQAALQAVIRRDEFDPAARLVLFAELAAHFRSLTALPPEIDEGISDEPFVANVVEVLFGAKASTTPASNAFRSRDALPDPRADLIAKQ